MSQLEKRQNSLIGISTEQIEEALDFVKQKFESHWLKNHGQHPLQLLWKRRDALATNELYIFGRALISSSRASENWLREKIKIIKSKDENNMKGAVFEVLAIGYTSPKEPLNKAQNRPPSCCKWLICLGRRWRKSNCSDLP